jgi:hypothetical protein
MIEIFGYGRSTKRATTYLLVADVARGDGADNSVFHVLNVGKMEVVAEYQGKPTLDMYAQMLHSAGRIW